MTVHESTLVLPIMRLFSRFFLKCIGWKIEGECPNIPKYVMIAAPHTSNWDFVIALAIIFVYRINIQIMMKDTWFFWPLGPIFRWLGVMPINRSNTINVVSQCIEDFRQNEEKRLMVPPSGTRKKVLYWKTGFYRIAHGAGVPIAMGFLDYRRKRGGIGPVFHPTGDIDRDMEIVRDFYLNISGKYPDQSVQAQAPSKSAQ
jgi:1-acyl-sn-glycerol-3-phosphate acyltransferase